jgi:hypothetical protein
MKRHYITIIIAVALFIWIGLPILLLPATYALPVIQTTTFEFRAFWHAVVIAVLLFAFFFSAKKNDRQKGKEVFKSGGFRGIAIMLIFAFGMIYCLAQWGANTFGILIKALPNHVYENNVELISKDHEVPDYYTRKQSIVLTFQDKQINKLSALELSRTLFRYPHEPSPQAGDTLTLKGKENLFGVYVEELTIYPKSEKVNPYILKIADGNYIFVLPILFILSLIFGVYFFVARPLLIKINEVSP